MISSIVKEVYKRDGFLGFYRGYFASLVAYVPNSALWWQFYHFYQGKNFNLKSFLNLMEMFDFLTFMDFFKLHLLNLILFLPQNN